MPFTPEFIDRITTKNCTVSLDENGALLIKGTSKNPYTEMEVTFPAIPLSQGDLNVFFEALAVQPLSGYDVGDRIPRQIFVHADGMPEPPADQIGPRPMYNDIMALMGTAGWQENYAYFRKAGEGIGAITITLRIENQGTCKIRNMTAHNAPLSLVREFEKGIVLVNASRETITIDLSSLLPDTWSKGLWRIKADPADYVPSEATNRMLGIHNGSKLDSPNVILPPLEGFFLCNFPQ
jgi:hypothetical protein